MENPILERVALATQKANAAAKTNEDIQNDILSAMKDEQATLVNAARNSAAQQQIIARQQSVAQMQQEININDAYATSGGRKAFNNLLKTRADTVAELQKDLDAVNKQMDKDITGIGLIDAVINTYASVGDRVRLETDQERLSSIDNAIAGTAQAVQAASSIEGHVKRTVTAATIAAEQKKIASDAEVLAAKLQLDALSTNAVQVERVTRASGVELDNIIREANVRNAINSERNSSIRDRILEMQLKGVEREEASLQAQAKEVAIGRAKLGKEAISEDVIIADLQDKERRKEYADDIIAGKYGWQGADTGDAILRAVKQGSFRSPAQQEIAEQIISRSSKKDQGSIQKKAQNLSKAYHDTIVPGDPNNWYNFPGLAAVSEVAEVKTSKLYSEILGVQEANIRTHNDVIDATVSAIVSGNISYKDAAKDIVTTFKATTALNNGLKDFNGMRLPEQTKYNAQVKYLPGSGLHFGVYQVVDLTDITQVEQMLIKLRVSK